MQKCSVNLTAVHTAVHIAALTGKQLLKNLKFKKVHDVITQSRFKQLGKSITGALNLKLFTKVKM